MSSDLKLNTAGSHTRSRQPSTAGWSIHLIAMLAVVCLVGIRAASELGMMSIHGSDPQMPIWFMFFLAALAFWAVTGFCAWLPALVWNNRPARGVATILLLIWSAAIGNASWKYYESARALSQASNPATSSERLSELVHFPGIQAGYELDNRIAANPNTPPDALRQLHAKDQLGTAMILARNPNTPPDILAELADHDDEFVRRSLHQNPKLPGLLRLKLKLNPK